MDEREEELRQQWADHRQRFKSGAKRSTLRGVIKSSYLTELSDCGGRDPRSTARSRAAGGGQEEGSRHAASHGSSLPHGPGALVPRHASNHADDDTDSWEDVRRSSSDDATTTAAATAVTAGADASTPRLPPPRETVHLLTTPGPTRVTIVGDRGGGTETGTGTGTGRGTGPRLAVLTLHAAGHNHRTCLGALEREVANDEELGGGGREGGGRGVVFYHVDTPGHEEEGTGVE